MDGTVDTTTTTTTTTTAAGGTTVTQKRDGEETTDTTGHWNGTSKKTVNTVADDSTTVTDGKTGGNSKSHKKSDFNVTTTSAAGAEATRSGSTTNTGDSSGDHDNKTTVVRTTPDSEEVTTSADGQTTTTVEEVRSGEQETGSVGNHNANGSVTLTYSGTDTTHSGSTSGHSENTDTRSSSGEQVVTTNVESDDGAGTSSSSERKVSVSDGDGQFSSTEIVIEATVTLQSDGTPDTDETIRRTEITEERSTREETYKETVNGFRYGLRDGTAHQNPVEQTADERTFSETANRQEIVFENDEMESDEHTKRLVEEWHEGSTYSLQNGYGFYIDSGPPVDGSSESSTFEKLQADQHAARRWLRDGHTRHERRQPRRLARCFRRRGERFCASQVQHRQARFHHHHGGDRRRVGRNHRADRDLTAAPQHRDGGEDRIDARPHERDDQGDDQ